MKNLSNILRDLDDVFPERSLTNQQIAALKDNLQGCENVLIDLNKVLDKYHELGDVGGRTAQKSRRFWKRLTYEPEDVAGLRSRLSSNIGLLNSFSGSISMYVHILSALFYAAKILPLSEDAVLARKEQGSARQGGCLANC